MLSEEMVHDNSNKLQIMITPFLFSQNKKSQLIAFHEE